MNEMTVNYTKTKKDLYNIVQTVFNETNDLNNFSDKYMYYFVGVRYNNGVFFEYEAADLWDIKDRFYNYFKKHTVQDVDFIYVVDMNEVNTEVYISKEIQNIDTTNIRNFFRDMANKFAQEHKYINFVDNEDELYD